MSCYQNRMKVRWPNFFQKDQAVNITTIAVHIWY